MKAPNFKIEVKSMGKDPVQFMQDIQAQFYPELQGELEDLAIQTRDKMREVIDSSRKRPNRGTNKLEKAIDYNLIETHPAGVTIGIGEIEKLNQEAPYWEMINNGATYTTKKEHIVPFEDGGFRTFKVGSSHVIEGINYVGQAVGDLINKLRELSKSWVVQALGKIGK